MAVRDVVQAAAGVGGDKLYVEDVFSTYLFVGNDSTLQIQNGINLSEEGGLIWEKTRNEVATWNLYDTERGVTKRLMSNNAFAQQTTTGLTSFNTDGVTLASGDLNYANYNHVLFSFRKAPKFFDVVTYTGNGTTQNIAHNLGSVPGMIIVKKYNGTSSWAVYHRSVGNTNALLLNATNPSSDFSGSEWWNNTTPTSTQFTVGGNDSVNNSGGLTYVAYLFAHDAGGFGDDGEQNVISCGSVSGQQTINLGWEPQWLLMKRTDSAGDWRLVDAMRGLTAVNSNDAWLAPNTNAAESASDFLTLNSTGFFSDLNGTYIYIAIRRPMKTPESGTEVFSSNLYTGDSVYNKNIDTTITPDLVINSYRNASGADHHLFDRLRGWDYGDLWTNATSAENVSNAPILQSPATMGSIKIASSGTNYVNYSGYNYVNHSFKRAPGFMDVVAYTGTGVAGHVVNHNLGVAPEWIITKKRSSGGSFNDWYTVSSVYYNTIPYDRQSALNVNNGFTGGGYISGADSTSFTLKNAYVGNETGHNIVAYLFASVPNVSKVGTYTGTGSDVNVDCGFSSGARFVYVQRADATGTGKYIWDSARGIVSGNDPYLLINSTAVEEPNTDYIDPLASGFTVTSNASSTINISGAIYFFLAIA